MKFDSKLLVSTIIVIAFSFSMSKPARAENAQEYLDKALQIIETRAMNRAKVNWSDVRSRARSMSVNAAKPADTYQAIVYALSRLNDNHSHMMRPDGKPVSFSGLSSRGSNSRPQKTTQREGDSGFLQCQKGRVGYIVVKEVSGTDAELNEYGTALRKHVARCRTYGVKGWVIDLRGNTGGNMWPMLVGIGPVLGAGTLGYFVYGNYFVPWYYRQGAAGVNSVQGARANFSIADGMSDFYHTDPIAVLIDRNTASSGEAVAISFRGRLKTRFFGEKTSGLSTANESIKLSDGATILLTTSIEADRTKKLYPDGIDADINIDSGNVPAGSAKDPVIAASIKWIESN